MSKVLIVTDIKVCAHCLMLDYEYRAFCEHLKVKGDNFVSQEIRGTGFPDWCPLPDEVDL